MERVDEAHRVVPAPPGAVFAALVDADARAAWLPPAGMSAAVEWFDPRPGGGYRMVLTYDDPVRRGKSGDNRDVVEVRFMEVTAPQRVVEAAEFVSDDPELAGRRRRGVASPGMTFEVAGEAYDRFMGRYSRPLAATLADWLEVTGGQRAVDVGCGPGALTGHLVERLGAEHVAAVDPSPPFVEACRSRFPGVDVRQGTAESLPYDADSFDVAGSCLVVHFMSDPIGGLAEMARVTRPGGWVGATTWDLAGSREPMAPIWAALAEVDPDHPGEGPIPAGASGELVQLLEGAGLREVEGTEMPVTVTHPTFEEWWEPYLRGVGPVGEVIAALEPARREQLRATCRERLGDGPFDVTAVAFAARGRA